MFGNSPEAPSDLQTILIQRNVNTKLLGHEKHPRDVCNMHEIGITWEFYMFVINCQFHVVSIPMKFNIYIAKFVRIS